MNTRLLFTLIVLLAAALVQGQRCDRICKFRLCRPNEFLAALRVAPKILPGAAGVASTPFICSTSESFTNVKTGEPEIQMDDGGYTKMKDWAAPSTPFPPKFYFASSIKFFGGRKGIAHKTPTLNQWSLLDTRCVSLPVLSLDGTKLPKDDENCVLFRSRNPMMQITTAWDSDDDINMFVSEPDTEVVAAGSPSSGGVHTGNNNIDACGKVLIGSENVQYKDECMPGEYCVRLRMKRNCKPDMTTKYTISVAKNGVEIASTSGKTDAVRGDFEKWCFTVPPPTTVP